MFDDTLFTVNFACHTLATYPCSTLANQTSRSSPLKATVRASTAPRFRLLFVCVADLLSNLKEPDFQMLRAGQSTLIGIYYLGLNLGKIDSIFTLRTNVGAVYYEVSRQYANAFFHSYVCFQVFAEGRSNVMRVQPLTNGVVPFGAKFRQAITIFNPFDQWFKVHSSFSFDSRFVSSNFSLSIDYRDVFKRSAHPN